MLKKYFRKIYYFIKNIKFLIIYKLKRKKKIHNDGIVLITNDFEKQGAPILLLNIARYFYDNGINLVILGFKYGPLIAKFSKYGNVIIRNKKELENTIRFLNEKHNYSRAICNTVVTGNYSETFKNNGYKVISLVHEMEQLIKLGKFEENCEKIIKNSNTIIFPSKYTYNSFLNCVNNKTFTNFKIKNQGLFNIEKNEMSKGELIETVSDYLKYDINNKFIVLNVATASYRKGFDLFIDIANSVEKINKNILFIWVGDKTNQILLKKYKQYGVVNFKNLILPGYIDDFHILNSLYSVANLFNLTSREEPFGSVVLESFKAGTPVLAFKNCGGYMDVVKDEITGYLVEPFNVDECAKKIIKIYENNEKNEKIAKNCKNEVKKYKFEDYCEMILEGF